MSCSVLWLRHCALMTTRAPDEELYDLEQNPHEINNLAGSRQAEHVEAFKRLRAALDEWLVETDDRGWFPESPALIAPFEKEMHDWFGTPALPWP